MSERLGETDYLDVLNQPSGEPELAAQASKKKGKRKMSRKARAAAMKNLAKARKAQKRRVKSVRSTARRIAKHKKSGGRGPTGPMKRTAKQRAAAKRNIKKAQKARRSKAKRPLWMPYYVNGKRYGEINRRTGDVRNNGKTHRLTPRRRARSTSAHTEAKTMKKGKRSKGKRKAHRSPAQKAAAKKNIKKAQAALRRKGRKGGKRKTLAKRRAQRTAIAPPKPRKAARRGGKARKRRFTQKARAAAMRNLGKARSARRRAKAAGRKHNVRRYSYHSKPKRVTVPAHRSYEKRGRRQSKKARKASLRNLRKARAALRHGGRRRSGHRARETYMEAMVNALTGVEVVFGGISGIVWFMVTDFVDRVLATHALTDKGTKDASGHELYADNPPTTGSYAGLFNATAICARMDVTRWLVGGLVMTALPLGVSFAIPNDIVRSCFQAAAGGAGIRIFGKALIDLVAYITMWNQIGQQLYDGEMRAQVYASGNTDPLASLPSSGLGWPDKAAGTGEAPAKDAKPGTGWPSMPRERADAQSSGAPPPPAPAVPTIQNPSPPQAGQPGYLAGLPPKRPGLYDWANREESVAA